MQNELKNRCVSAVVAGDFPQSIHHEGDGTVAICVGFESKSLSMNVKEKKEKKTAGVFAVYILVMCPAQKR